MIRLMGPNHPEGRPLFLLLTGFTTTVQSFLPLSSLKAALLDGRNSQQQLTMSTEPVSTTSKEIIPREVLFGNPTYAAPKQSPDGEF
jgi:hypothetical protein